MRTHTHSTIMVIDRGRRRNNSSPYEVEYMNYKTVFYLIMEGTVLYAITRRNYIF